MTAVMMIKCDNPGCGNLGISESADNPKHKGRPIDPYGWLTVGVLVVGSGPDCTVSCCSQDCIQAAVENEFERQRRIDRDGDAL